MNKTKSIGAMAMFALLLTGISGLAVAGSTTGQITLAQTNTQVSCNPSSIIAGYQSTTCTATVTGIGSTSFVPTPTGTVTLGTSDSGSFTGSPCTLSAGTPKSEPSCTATYSDLKSAGGTTPTITATYSGDVNYGPSSGTTSVSDLQAVCTVSAASTLALSGGKTATLTITNTGNVNGAVSVSGTDWYDSSAADSFAVGQTQWGLSSFAYGAGTPLSLSDVSLISVLAPNTPSTAVYFSAEAPVGTAAGAYTQTITLSGGC